jgi:hypothetical protein
MGEDVEKLKQRWPLLDYLQKQNWLHSPRVTTPSSSDSAHCMRKLSLRSMSMPARISSTVMAAAGVGMSFALSSCHVIYPSVKA